MDVRVKFSDSMLKCGQIIRLFAGHTRFTHVCVIFTCIFQPTGKGNSDVIYGKFVGPNVPDKPIKFRNPRLNRSREIPPQAVGGGIFDGFRNIFPPEVVSEVISGADV